MDTRVLVRYRRFAIRHVRLCQRGPYHLNDSREIIFHVVLPKPQNPPSGLRELFVHPPIPINVRPEFGSPELFVRLRVCSVEKALVPEAAVHEDGQALAQEDDVRLAGELASDSVSQSGRPQGAAKPHLRLRSTVPNIRHAATPLFGSEDVSSLLRILRPHLAAVDTRQSSPTSCSKAASAARFPSAIRVRL